MSVRAYSHAGAADACARLPKHVPQTGIAQPDAETALSSSSVCAVGALTSRSPRVSAPEYPLFILIAGPSIFRGCSSLTWKARCFCLALSILGRSLPVCGVCHLLAQRSSIYVWLCDAKKRLKTISWYADDAKKFKDEYQRCCWAMTKQVVAQVILSTFSRLIWDIRRSVFRIPWRHRASRTHDAPRPWRSL